MEEFENNALISDVNLRADFIPGLLINEVADPLTPSSGGARFVEIFNITTVDGTMNGHAIQRFANGTTTPTNINIPSGSVIPSFGTWVIANNQAEFEARFATGLADQFNGNISGNGDDAYSLAVDGQVIDVFGEIGVDGTRRPWEYTDGVATRSLTVFVPAATFDETEWNITLAAPADAFTPGQP